MFPFEFDFIFGIVLAFFSSFIQKKPLDSNSNSDSSQRLFSYTKQEKDEDLLTIPDDLSEMKSKISYKPLGLN